MMVSMLLLFILLWMMQFLLILMFWCPSCARSRRVLHELIEHARILGEQRYRREGEEDDTHCSHKHTHTLKIDGTFDVDC